MAVRSVAEWLNWIQSLNQQEIDLSLERVAEVFKRLGISQSIVPTVVVAGTNGKGSTVAGLEAIYLEAGFKVGAFTSPFLYRYNEQIHLQGQPIDDAVLCEAFSKITKASGDIILRPFEFGALAAMVIFQEANVDVGIFEVGLGGRFDAVNILDADIAIVTSIAMDHMEWLGNTREEIAFEKAGIFRPGQPAICGDFQPPVTLIQHANAVMAPLFCQGQQYGFTKKSCSWDWWCENTHFEGCPLPRLALQNMATVLMAVELLQKKLSVSRQVIDRVLRRITLPGRIQVIPDSVTRILDVSHNPAAIEFLANYLQENLASGKTHAVFSMYSDKDIFNSILAIRNLIDQWYVAPLHVPRGASSSMLIECFKKAKVDNIIMYPSVKEANQAAVDTAVLNDRIIVFGSFATVSMI